VIVGIGIDLVDVARMEQCLQRKWASRFLSRVFSPEEIASCEKSPRRAQAYAARFAAKEAFAKALGTGFSGGIAPSEIRIGVSDRKQPTILLVGSALEAAQAMKIASVHVSLSHTPQTASAIVITENTLRKE
jgi:holo-[acyl-carrier protein] synthase